MSKKTTTLHDVNLEYDRWVKNAVLSPGDSEIKWDKAIVQQTVIIIIIILKLLIEVYGQIMKKEKLLVMIIMLVEELVKEDTVFVWD